VPAARRGLRPAAGRGGTPPGCVRYAGRADRGGGRAGAAAGDLAPGWVPGAAAARAGGGGRARRLLARWGRLADSLARRLARGRGNRLGGVRAGLEPVRDPQPAVAERREDRAAGAERLPDLRARPG